MKTKGSTMVFQGILVLLLVGSLALGLRGRISAIADGMPNTSPTPSPTTRKAPVKDSTKAIAKTPAKLPSTVANAVRKDLSQQTGIPANQLQLIQSTSKTWSDGCLGLAKADEMCSQALVPGWQVVFSNGTRRWVYRTNATGTVYRMETPTT
jgi:hypothetical protein